MSFTSPLPLNISPQQLTTLFQTFVAHTNEVGNNDPSEEFPKDLVRILDSFHSAQSKFIKEIDAYIRKETRSSYELSPVKTIAEICPELLSFEDPFGNLPIHYAACDWNSSLYLVPAFVKLNRKSEWGGLLYSRYFYSVPIPLSHLIKNGDMETLQALSRIDSKILDFEGLVANSNAIHKALLYQEHEIMRWLVKKSPEGLYNGRAHAYHEFPIHSAKSLDDFEFVLHSAIEYRPHHDTVGGLFHKNNEGQLCIQNVIDTLEHLEDEEDEKYEYDEYDEDEEDEEDVKEKIFSSINQVLSHFNNTIPILHKAIEFAPDYANDVISYCPDSYYIQDEAGRLPIHVALATGMEWSMSFISLMNTSSHDTSFHQLGTSVDPVTGLCCGGLAAAGPSSCDLDTIYHLFKTDPGQIEYLRRKTSKTKRKDSPSYSGSRESKRRECE